MFGNPIFWQGFPIGHPVKIKVFETDRFSAFIWKAYKRFGNPILRDGFPKGNQIIFRNFAPCFIVFLGLRKVYPYYFTFKTYAKERWLNRGVIDVLSSEFRTGSTWTESAEKIVSGINFHILSALFPFKMFKYALPLWYVHNCYCLIKCSCM